MVMYLLQELQKKQDGSRRRLELRCMLPRLLELALFSNSNNRDADLFNSTQLKELVIRYSRLLGIRVEDLGLWLSDITTSSDYQVFTSPAVMRIFQCRFKLLVETI